MSASESIRQKTQAYHSLVRDVLSSMPAMTSGEFYAQMEKVTDGTATEAERDKREAYDKLAQAIEGRNALADTQTLEKKTELDSAITSKLITEASAWEKKFEALTRRIDALEASRTIPPRQ